MFKLVIQDDEGKTTVVPLIRDEITIGRKEGNTIRLTERNVSRRHARILRNNGEVQIEDLGSYNGIRVNNARIAERVSLRVSDQVQIGDYKLYLKAEGVEQVDDARTMPIERIDTPVATETMPVTAPGGSGSHNAITPSLPMTQGPAAQAAAAAAAARGAVNPTADTDPSGRPVATAAQVAALSASAAYGKLVVLSSNFAGKEFDLTRPQMIVGRTDENDLVINHRSISRNHAKVTRDPDTGRYTISDLQSSNGVRVNGQDYGKVELRRGDTVDLGHVRLRFVEPGEDFVFARDAVITDVTDTGGKKGLLVAIVLGILVLAGVAAFFVLNKKGDDGGKKTDNGQLVGSDRGTVGSDTTGAGSGSTTVAEIPVDAVAEVGVEPRPNGSGSDTAAAANALKAECLGYQSDKKWQDLNNCAAKLAAVDKDTANALKAKAKNEQANDVASGKLDDAIKEGSLDRARKAFDKIDDDSVYKKPAQAKYEQLEKQIVDEYKQRAAALKNQNKCADLARLVGQAAAQGPAVADAVRAFKCEAIAVNPNPNPNPHPGGGSGSATVTPPPTACDADALDQQWREDEGVGQHGASLMKAEKALQCKPNDIRVSHAFMSACNSGNAGKAKVYYKRLAPATRAPLVQMCVRNGIKIEQLEAP
jgi:ABC transport system ATP-binding/permease protein